MSDDVVVASTRCPFCHEHAAFEFVVCRRCLAKHHGECWLEHGTCASCGEARCIASTPARTAREQLRAVWDGPRPIELAVMSPRSRRVLGWFGLASAFFVPLFGLAIFFADDSAKPAATVAAAVAAILFVSLGPWFFRSGRAMLRAGKRRERSVQPDRGVVAESKEERRSADEVPKCPTMSS